MNFETVDVVISQMISKFRLPDHAVDPDVMAENIGEALKDIGAAGIFGQNSAVVTVNKYIAKLPTDLHSLVGISVDLPYRILGGFLQVDVPDGTEVTIQYQSMMVDTKGRPLVPDNSAVRSALVWYMARDLVLGGVLKTISWRDAEGEWQWHCGVARGEINALQMNPTMVDNIHRNYVNLGPTTGVKNNVLTDFTKTNRRNEPRL